MNDSDPPKPERHLFQFSMGTLLLVIVVSCVGFGWIGNWIRLAKNDRRIVEKLNEIGSVQGAVYEEYEWGRVTVLFLNNETRIINAGLEHLEGLTELKCLHLASTPITDAGLEHLKGLTALEELGLAGTQVTDAGLVHLEGMSNLRSLSLYDTQVTDEGVQKLQEALPNCGIRR
jgi:hypothetical protein